MTSALLEGHHVDKIMVADGMAVSIVDRDGCLAQVKERQTALGPLNEIHTLCPKPERMKSWFDGSDKVTAKLGYEALAPHGEEDQSDAIDERLDAKTASAKVLLSNGRTLRVTKAEDVAKLQSAVRALGDELAGTEDVAPGPASEKGWQMLHVSGPARVMFAGQPARGMLEARLSTNGQYECEFTTSVDGDTPLRATKSGWLKPESAAHAIDVVLAPFTGAGAGVAAMHATFAAGTKGGTEQRSNTASAEQVFELFSEVQDALGDACLPELEPPSGAEGASTRPGPSIKL